MIKMLGCWSSKAYLLYTCILAPPKTRLYLSVPYLMSPSTRPITAAVTACVQLFLVTCPCHLCLLWLKVMYCFSTVVQVIKVSIPVVENKSCMGTLWAL